MSERLDKIIDLLNKLTDPERLCEDGECFYLAREVLEDSKNLKIDIRHMEMDTENLTAAIGKIVFLDNALMDILDRLRSAQFECSCAGEKNEKPVTCLDTSPDDRSMWCPDCFALSIIMDYGEANGPAK